MVAFARILLLGALAGSLTSSASAGTTTDSGVYEVQIGHVVFSPQASVSFGARPVAENGLVSGTNVTAGFGGSFRNEVPEPPSDDDQIVEARLDAYEVWIGGENLLTRSAPTNTGWPPQPWPQGTSIRWASTKFPDGATVEVRTIAKYSARGHTDPANTYPIQLLVTAERKVRVYNKLQTLGTTVLSTGANDTTGKFREASNVMARSATEALASSHTAMPGASALSENRDAIMTKAEFSTVMTALVHGSPSEFRTSDGTQGIQFSNDILPLTYSRQNGTSNVPAYNLAGFWSCSTLASGSIAAPVAYDLLTYAGWPYPDRGYVGFDSTVSIVLWPTSRWGTRRQISPDEMFNEGWGSPPNTLGDHAREFWTQIALGQTVFDSMRIANALYAPAKGEFPGGLTRYDLVLRGDPWTRLVNVYLTQAEYDARVNATPPLDTNVWWVRI